jgi:hypothetical protein
MSRRANGAASQLLRIGREAGNRAEAGGIRFAALLIAAFLLPLALAAPTVAAATFDGRFERAALHTYTPATAETPTEEILLLYLDLDSLPNSRQYQINYLTPLGERAALPPGIPDWPGPNEVYLSPKLAELGAEHGIAERYGEVVGLINEAGLIDPDQLLAYAGPAWPLKRDQAAAEDLSIVEIAAWGTSDEWRESINWLLLDQDFAEFAFHVLSTALVTVPAALLAFAATRVASHARDRREALIRILGGRPRHLLLVSLGESWAPTAVGSAAALCVLIMAMSRNIPLPYVDFTLSAADLHSVWPLLIGCVILSLTALFSMTLFIGIGRLQGREPTRDPASRRSRMFATAAWLFPVCFAVAAWGPSFFSAAHPGFYLMNYVGQIGIIVTVAPAVALSCAFFARTVKQLPWARVRSALLVSASRVAAYPRATARQLTGVTAAFFILFFALAYHSNWTAWVHVDRAALAQIDGSVADGRPPGGFDPSALEEFIGQLPEELALLSWTVDHRLDESKSVLTINGSCEALAVFRLDCPDGHPTLLEGSIPDDRLEVWAAGWLPNDNKEIIIRNEPLSVFLDTQRDSRPSLLIATADGDPLPEAEIRAAGTVFQLGLNLNVLGSGQEGATPSEEQARWIVAFGSIALAILALAAMLVRQRKFVS